MEEDTDLENLLRHFDHLINFLGEDNDINVGTDNPEFSEWKWTKIHLIVDEIVPFKRDVYSKILEEFKDIF